MFLLGVLSVSAQQTPSDSSEQSVPLTQTAVALDGRGTPALEGTLRTTALNGAPDTPVTNIRVVIKNVGPSPFSYVSGLVTLRWVGNSLR